MSQLRNSYEAAMEAYMEEYYRSQLGSIYSVDEAYEDWLKEKAEEEKLEISREVPYKNNKKESKRL